MDQRLTLQEKIRKQLIKTPIKVLNQHFNYSYIFSKPSPEEMQHLQAQVANSLSRKNRQ